MKMSNSMKIIPLYNNLQNIIQMEQPLIPNMNYNSINYQNIGQTQIQNRLLTRSNSSFLTTVNINGCTENSIPIIPLSPTVGTSPQTKTSLYYNHQPIRITKQIDRRRQLSPQPQHINNYFSQSNFTNFNRDIKYYDTNINLNPIKKNDIINTNLTSFEEKPIKRLIFSRKDNEINRVKSKIMEKFPYPLTTRNKLNDSNINKNMNKFKQNNYYFDHINSQNIYNSSDNNDIDNSNENMNMQLGLKLNHSTNDIKSYLKYINNKQINQEYINYNQNEINNELNDIFNKTDNKIKKENYYGYNITNNNIIINSLYHYEISINKG